KNRAIALLGEFVQAGPVKWDGLGSALDLILPTTQAAILDEIHELIELIEYRPGIMAEALAQKDSILAYWQGLLMFNGKSHPKTTGLIEVARCIGQFQVMHYKWIYQRMRPSQVSPALMPPINPPGHAAFPSGHAT